MDAPPQFRAIVVETKPRPSRRVRHGNWPLARVPAAIDARDTAHGATPLFLAASWGRKQMVKFLLEKGAGKLIRNKDGKSPREAALENSHAEIAELLR